MLLCVFLQKITKLSKKYCDEMKYHKTIWECDIPSRLNIFFRPRHFTTLLRFEIKICRNVHYTGNLTLPSIHQTIEAAPKIMASLILFKIHPKSTNMIKTNKTNKLDLTTKNGEERPTFCGQLGDWGRNRRLNANIVQPWIFNRFKNRSPGPAIHFNDMFKFK